MHVWWARPWRGRAFRRPALTPPPASGERQQQQAATLAQLRELHARVIAEEQAVLGEKAALAQQLQAFLGELANS